jgi:hypothetical protein
LDHYQLGIENLTRKPNELALREALGEAIRGKSGQWDLSALMDEVNESLNLLEDGPWHVFLSVSALRVGICHFFQRNCCTVDMETSPPLHAAIVHGIYQPGPWPK